VLDAQLADGWFRFGGTMRTTSFTVWEERHLRTTLWTRTSMNGFLWSKSNRRLLGRVRSRFTVEEGPMRLDAEHELLYARYIAHVGGERPPSLTEFLGGDELVGCYATREISIRDGGRLVAFSLFDLGRASVMSLLGVFDPDLQRESLGYATMALEVDLARERALGWHYSGYVLPGEPRMDYKLRVGGMEFLDPDTHLWRPITELDVEQLPDQRMRVALDRVGRRLGTSGVRCRRMLNPLFELADSPVIVERMVDQPMMLMVHTLRAPFPIVTWNDPERRFEVWDGQPAVIRHRRTAEGPERTTATALIQREIGRYRLAAEAAEAVRAALR
jgi:arginyl-tRNA--protein-N-Asp/Glu arginylyltransferase